MLTPEQNLESPIITLSNSLENIIAEFDSIDLSQMVQAGVSAKRLEDLAEILKDLSLLINCYSSSPSLGSGNKKAFLRRIK